jgi:thiamine biosynthesis lipoprotein
MMFSKSLILLSLILPILSGCGAQQTVKETRIHMDTVIQITASGPVGVNTKEAVDGAFGRIKRIERLLSKYDPGSEISRVNDLTAGVPLPLSPETYSILNKALEISDKTGGAFDITVSPLVDIWRKYKMLERLPSEDEIDMARAITGPGLLSLDDAGSITLLKEGANIDLSGIAKGYAVDKAASFLRESGVKDAIIDAGGDIYCMGQKGRAGWRVGVKDPRGNLFLGVLTLSDMAVATSGDYQRFFMIDGIRYSHIIDPKTGYPAKGAPISVTIIADDCATADALATALSAMAPEAGLDLINGLDGVDAIIMNDTGSGVETRMTGGAARIYEEK